jgi:hypothetical protein
MPELAYKKIPEFSKIQHYQEMPVIGAPLANRRRNTPE